jgi:N-acetylmuramoyl-L-alanine amidase
MSMIWQELIRTYAEASIEAPALKLVTVAQWALESGYGSSALATEHNNFAGLKYRERVNRGREGHPLATPVDYIASDGEDTYCKFANFDDFIAGYWAFVKNGSMYDGWEAYGLDPIGYIGHLHRAGYAGDQRYVAKVAAVVPTVTKQIEDLGLASAFSGINAPALTRLAILIGHNDVAKGAFSPHLLVSEWDYNQRVAREMQAAASEFGLEPRVFFRDRNRRGYATEIAIAYAAIDAWDPAAIMELHFNAGGGTGTETLYWHSSRNGKKLADAVREAILGELDMRDRGSRARRSGDRGSTSLRVSAHPTILTEPFFGDSDSDCDRMLEVGETGLARAYLIGARDYFMS